MTKRMPKHAWMRYEQKERVVILGETPKNGTTHKDPWLTAKAFKNDLCTKYPFMKATAGEVGTQIIAGWNVPGTVGEYLPCQISFWTMCTHCCNAGGFCGNVPSLEELTRRLEHHLPDSCSENNKFPHVAASLAHAGVVPPAGLLDEVWAKVAAPGERVSIWNALTHLPAPKPGRAVARLQERIAGVQKAIAMCVEKKKFRQVAELRRELLRQACALMIAWGI